MTKWKDPVVEETRAAGRQLAAQAGGDLHAFFEQLRHAQQRYAAPVVDRLAASAQPGAETPAVSHGS
jgi:hypothetical protein